MDVRWPWPPSEWLGNCSQTLEMREGSPKLPAGKSVKTPQAMIWQGSVFERSTSTSNTSCWAVNTWMEPPASDGYPATFRLRHGFCSLPNNGNKRRNDEPLPHYRVGGSTITTPDEKGLCVSNAAGWRPVGSSMPLCRFQTDAISSPHCPQIPVETNRCPAASGTCFLHQTLIIYVPHGRTCCPVHRCPLLFTGQMSSPTEKSKGSPSSPQGKTVVAEDRKTPEKHQKDSPSDRTTTNTGILPPQHWAGQNVTTKPQTRPKTVGSSIDI